MNSRSRATVAASILLLGLAGLLASSAQAATLTIGSGEVLQDQPLEIPVLLEAGADPAPAVLAFTLTFGLAPLVVVNVEAGAAALAAQKSVSSYPIAGGVRVLIGGVNENSLADGELVRVHIALAPLAELQNAAPFQGVDGSAAPMGRRTPSPQASRSRPMTGSS